MEKTIGAVIHNRFDFEVKDSITGELKQKASAYNVILDAMWAALCAGSNYFYYISLGSGTGTLDHTRTSLFNEFCNVSATNVANVMALPTSYNKKKIVLNPSDYVGKVISEVGIRSGYDNSLLTHALLQDSEGNPITITKTATDIVTVYATVFSSITETEELKIIGMPSSNPLLRYLCGLTTNYSWAYLYTGQSDIPTIPTMQSTASSYLGYVTVQANVTKDIANKKVTSSVGRFEVGASNGNIQEIGINSVVRMTLPNSFCAAKTYAGVSLGTGDGSKKDFVIPSKNIDPASLVVYVNGTATTDYVLNSIRTGNFKYASGISGITDSKQRLVKKDPTTDNWFGILGDGTVYYYGTVNQGFLTKTGSLTLGYANNDITRYFDISVEHLIAVPYKNTVNFLDFSTGVPVVSTVTLDIAPESLVTACTFSPDGQHLTVLASNRVPYRYKRVGNVFTKLPALSGELLLSSTTSNPVGFCKYFGDFLIVRHSLTSPYISSYTRTGDTYVLNSVSGGVSYPASHANYSTSMCMNDSHTLLLAACWSTSKVEAWAVDSSGNLTKLPDISVPGGTNTIGVLCNIGNNMIILADVSAKVRTYKLDDETNTLTLVETFSLDGGETIYASYDIAQLGDDLLVIPDVINGSPYTIVPSCVDIKARTSSVHLNTPPATSDAITADYTVNGIHKTSNYIIDLQFSTQFSEGV